jgi:Cu+-exporting ATPase
VGAKNGILIRDPVALEAAGATTIMAFDKTGTLTIGTPKLAEIGPGEGISRDRALALAAGLQRGANHPLAHAVIEAAARHLAQEIGLDDLRAELLPADKVDAVAELKGKGEIVAMVGDGINDAPALAAADLGIAMATGTDVAIETAGIALMRGDPLLAPAAIDLARATRRKIVQNLVWAFLFNVLGIPLAALGGLTPVVAGAAMALSSVTVVTNALSLNRWRFRHSGDAR